jgi:hypothetical protein
MFVKATRVTSGGRQLTYLQLVESYRDGGRVRQRVIKKLGREDELDPAAIERLVRSLAKYADVEVGAGNVWMRRCCRAWRSGTCTRWSTCGTSSSSAASCAIWRLVAGSVRRRERHQGDRVPAGAGSGSERSLVRSFLPSVFAPEFEGIELQHTYRALAVPRRGRPGARGRLTGVMTEKLFADASLVLFDTTSTYFEGAGPEELASFGFSRDKRGTGRKRTWRC